MAKKQKAQNPYAKIDAWARQQIKELHTMNSKARDKEQEKKRSSSVKMDVASQLLKKDVRTEKTTPAQNTRTKIGTKSVVNPADWNKTNILKQSARNIAQKNIQPAQAGFKDWSMYKNVMDENSAASQLLKKRPQAEQDAWNRYREQENERIRQEQERIAQENARVNRVYSNYQINKNNPATWKSGNKLQQGMEKDLAQKNVQQEPAGYKDWAMYKNVMDENSSFNRNLKNQPKEIQDYWQGVKDEENERIRQEQERIAQQRRAAGKAAWVQANPKTWQKTGVLQQGLAEEIAQKNNQQTQPGFKDWSMYKNVMDEGSSFNKNLKNQPKEVQDYWNKVKAYNRQVEEDNRKTNEMYGRVEDAYNSTQLYNGWTPEVRKALKYENAQQDISTEWNLMRLGVYDNGDDISMMNSVGRNKRRKDIETENVSLEKQKEELQKEQEALQEEQHQLNIIKNSYQMGPSDIVFHYGKKYKAAFEQYIKDENLEIKPGEYDRVFAQFIMEESQKQKEDLEGRAAAVEYQLQNNSKALNDLDYYDDYGVDGMMYKLMHSKDSRAAKKTELQDRNEEIRQEIEGLYNKLELHAYDEGTDVDELRNQIDALEIERDKNNQMLDMIENYSLLDDEIEDDYSYHQDYYNNYKAENEDLVFNQNYETSNIHLIVDFINGGETYQKWYQNDGFERTITSAFSGAEAMLKEERQQLTALYNDAIKNGRQPVEAQAYLEGLQPYLNQRLRKYEEIRNMANAAQYPIISSAMTGVESLLTSIPTAVMTTYGQMTGANWAKDPNGWLLETQRHIDDTEGYVAQKLGNVGGFFYKSFMSMYKNLLRGAVFGGLGNAASAANLTQFYAESFVANYEQGLNKYHDENLAGTYAMMDAAISTFFEVASVEKFYSDPTNFAQYMLQNTTAEMSEELAEAKLGPYIHQLTDGSDPWGERAAEIYEGYKKTGTFTDNKGNEYEFNEQTKGIAAKQAYMQSAKEWNAETIESMASAGISAGAPAAYGGVKNQFIENRFNQGIGTRALRSGVTENDEKTLQMTKELQNEIKMITAAQQMGENTESKKLGDKIYGDFKKGIVNKKDYGKLVRTIIQESDEKIAGITKEMLGDSLKQELLAAGEKDAEAETLSRILADGIITQQNNPVMWLAISGNENAKRIWNEYRDSDAVKEAQAKIAPMQAAQKSVMELITEPRSSGITEKSVSGIMQGAQAATAEDIREADANGQRTGGKLEVIADGMYGEITGFATKNVKGEDGKNQSVVQVKIGEGAGARTVDISEVKGLTDAAAQVLQVISSDRGQVIGNHTAMALMQIADGTKNLAGTISDAMNTMWAAAMEQKAPRTNLDTATQETIANAVRADMEAGETARLQNWREIRPGQGTTTYNGFSYGSQEFNEAIGKLGKTQLNEANVIGNYAKSMGVDVQLYYDVNERAKQGAFYGGKDGAGIRINLAGTINQEGAHRSALATFAHEVTHNIEANSPTAYRALRSFMLQNLEKNGINLQKALQHIMDNYAAHGESIDLNGALAELVAMGSEQVLTNEDVAAQLKENDPKLFRRVQKAVSDLINRIRGIKGDVLTTSSKYARALMNVSDRMGKVWLAAYEEAKGTAATAEIGEGNGKLALMQYNDDEKQEILQDKRNIIYDGNRSTFTTFYNKGINAGKEIERMYFGKIDKALASRIKADTGIDVNGYSLVLANHEIRKISVIDHGNAQKEATRGQVVIGEQELFDAITVITDYDTAELDKKLYMGLPLINFKKEINGKETAAAYSATGRKNLRILTVYKGINKNGSLPMVGGVTSAPLTSKTSHGATSINNVAQNNNNGKSQKSIQDDNYEAEYRAAYERMTDARIKLSELKGELDDLNKRIATTKAEDMDALIQEVAEWEKKTGYGQLQKEYDDAVKAYEKANDNWTKYIEQRDEAEEQEKIRESGLTEPEWRRKQAVNQYGYTGDFREAGYLLPNGRMLNFCGSKGQHYGMRGNDHRDIGQIYANKQGSEAMVAFMADGNIRIMAESPGIDISTAAEPTTAQYTAIRNMANRFADEEYFNLDFTDKNGNNVGNIEYEGTINPSRIVNDIRHYFRTGEVREQSTTSMFHGGQWSIQDENYMEAVDRGDMETAQKIADRAARKAGYTLKVYHGTPTGGFTVFRDWSYFTENKNYADRYNHASASSIRGSYETTTPQTYELYMNPGKVFDTREKEARKLFNEARMEYGLTSLENMQRGLPDWTDGRDIIEFLEDRGLDYDTILLDEGGDGGYGAEVVDRGISYVSRSNRVKSADPVTYDDDGNVIPLSERFNTKNNDIRWSIQDDDYMDAVNSGDMDAAQRMVDQAAEAAMPDSKIRKEDGTLRKLYHGTYSDTFTVFDKNWIGTVREGDTGFFGRGFYFTFHKGEAKAYGSNVMEVFVDIKNPFNFMTELNTYNGERAHTYGANHAVFAVNWARKFPELNFEEIGVFKDGERKTLSLKQFADEFEEIYNNKEFEVRKVESSEGDYWEVLADPKKVSYTNTDGETFTWDEYGFRQKFYTEEDARNKTQQTYQYMANSVYDYISIPSAPAIVMSSNLTDVLIERGYDGVIQSEDGDEVVAFESSQIKLADPVTYDDNGNVIPPSERFNDQKKDIRWSMQDDTDYDVKAWMETVPEWSLRTEAEKELLRKYGSIRRKGQMDQLRMEKIDAEIKRLEGMQGKAAASEGTPVVAVTVDDVLRANGIVQDGAMLKKGGVIIGSLKLGVLNIYDKYKDIRKTLQDSGAFEYDEKTASWTAEAQNIHADQERDIQKRLEELRIRKENLQKTMDRTNDQLAEITGSEGFGGMMYRQQKVLNDLVYNKTQAEVQESVEKMTQAAAKIRQTVEENKAKAAELEKSGVVEQFRKMLGTTTEAQSARELKQAYSSTWTAKQIQEYLDPIILKMKSGEDFSQDVETLAGILVNSDSRNTYEELEALRGLTITLGKGAQAELKAQGSSLKEVRARLAGTGITVKFGERSTLEADIEDLRAEYPMIPELGDEKDALGNFLNWIDSMKSASAAGEFYDQRLAEAMAVITGKAAGAAKGIYMPNDPKAQKQVLAMMEFVKGLNAETLKAQDALQQVADEMEAMQKAGREASGKTAVLMRDVNVALDYYNRISRIAVDEAKQKRTEATIEQLKSEQAQKILKNNEEWRQLIQRDAEARKQLEENRKAQAQINTSLKRMYNLLQNPKGTKNIPEYMQGLAREVLGMFANNDASGGRRFLNATQDGLQNMLRVLSAWEAQDGKFNIADLEAMQTDAVVINLVQDLDIIREGIKAINTPVNGKNKLDTLQQRGITMKNIQEAVSEIYSAIRAEQEVQIGDRRVSVEDAAYKVAQGTVGKNYREWTGTLGGVVRTLHKAIISGNMTPEYFFRTIGNEGLSDLWDAYHWAENRNGLELARAKARLEEIAKQHKFDTWDMGQKIRLELEGGETELTLGQLMSLWATWKREKTLGPQMSEHLTKGGFFAEKDLRDGILGRTTMERKAHRVTEADMAKVKDLLTDEQRKFVDDVVLFMSRDMSELGNAASMAAYGIRMYKEKYYFPFQMWDGVKSRKSNDAGAAAGANDRAFHPSFSKSRVHGANNALVIGDFMQTAADHIAGMINYATMGLANESMQKVLNQQTAQGPYETKRNTRAILEEAYGREVMQYLAELQNQLNGGAVRTTRSLGDKAISIFRKNAVAGSLSVSLQQPLSYIRAAMMINPKYLTKAAMTEYWKDSYKERMAHSGVSVIKEMGRFDMALGQSAREYLTPDGKESTGRKVWEGVKEYSTILPELMDRWTWNRMWVAVKAEQHALHPEMDVKSDEFLDMVGERFNEVMRRTQVYDSVLVKSANMRSDNYWVKGITSFMAEPTLTANVLADAVRSAAQKEKGGKLLLAKAGATFVLSAALQAVFKALVSTGRTPDENKTWLENFLYRFFINFQNEVDPLQLIPGYSDGVALLKNGELQDDAMGAIGKIFTAGQKGVDLLLGNGKKGWYRDLEDSVGQLVQLFSGLPLKNLMRDARAMYNWAIDQPYAARATNANVIKYQTIDTFFNGDNLLGAINKKLKESGWETSNSAYYKRIYDAQKEGRYQDARDMTEYLLYGKNISGGQKTIDKNVNAIAKKDDSISAEEKLEVLEENGYGSLGAYIMEKYKNGKIDRETAETKYREANPNKSDDDVWWVFDQIEYQKETGSAETPTGKYYRLWDAMDTNKTDDIKDAIQTMKAHGVEAKNIKTQITKQYKAAYLEADADGKRTIRDAIQKAYKLLGYTAEDADKVINKWK